MSSDGKEPKRGSTQSFFRSSFKKKKVEISAHLIDQSSQTNQPDEISSCTLNKTSESSSLSSSQIPSSSSSAPSPPSYAFLLSSTEYSSSISSTTECSFLISPLECSLPYLYCIVL